PNAAFDVFQIAPDGQSTKINSEQITKTTDYVAKNIPKESLNRWQIRLVQNSGEKAETDQSAIVSVLEKPYLSIPLKEGVTFDRIAFADLTGDGRLDYVIKTPNSNIDPYINYWKPSPSTYQILAYTADGQLLWEYDLGWGVEQGIWYSPFIVDDLDGDGMAEVITRTVPNDFRNKDGRVYSGIEQVTIIDGKTGKERIQIDLPSRDGLPYNLSNRHQLCVAYLDGKTPCLIVERGTYSQMTARAYQFQKNPDRLELLWEWNNLWEQHLGRWGQGAHTTHAFDCDGDGRDEVLLGSILLDDDGSVLWEKKLGHPDHMYLGDIDPERPGLEIVYGIESRQKINAICMVDAKTGELIWGTDRPSTHIHSTGMVSDIDARFPGCEIWSGERDEEKDRWLRDAHGTIIPIPEKFPIRSLGPRSVWWDEDEQRELLIGNTPTDYPSFNPVCDTKIEGDVRLIGDILGDWREEIVTTVKGELRIYSTSIPAQSRRTTLLKDRNYRATLRESTSGYWQIPLPIQGFK
ncbi:MAG: hypothetical protein ACRCUY_07510, partial [Thermoguttaceae bacterium]